LRLISEHKFDGIDDVVIYKVWPLSNATYLVNSQISSDKDLTRFQIYSREDELLDMNSEMPELTGDDNQAYIQSFITMSPNNQHLASVTLMGQILELYDLSDTTITRRLENIYNFPNVIDSLLQSNEPAVLTKYIFNLTQKFSKFYEEVNVNNEEDKDLKQSRLKLLQATKTVLTNALEILGISTIDKM
jgi:hypothetical protein